MNPIQRLSEISRQISDGKTPEPVTTREFLSWFGTKRRGSWKIQVIREHLAAAQLRTDPDFVSQWIDNPIEFRRTTVSSIAESGIVEISGEGTIRVESSGTGFVLGANEVEIVVELDPAHAISRLKCANTSPLKVAPNAKLSDAYTEMLLNDYSQLPVMSGDRDVKGVISWQSIGARMAKGVSGDEVRHFMDSPQEIPASSSIFQAVPIVAQHHYVLVRAKDNKISGIITSADLSLQFKQLAEPFLVLSDIENNIRRLIRGKFTLDELRAVSVSADADRQIQRVDDLTFGDYVYLLGKPENWARLNVNISREKFCRELDAVREIRNDIMHFEPEPLDHVDLELLGKFSKFLSGLV